jgi:Uma2 family endonuclease
MSMMLTEDVTKKLFTIEEFQQMENAGIFPPDSRFELIRGEVIEMAATTGWHSGRVNKLTRLFTATLGERVIVSVQNEAFIRPQQGPMSKPKPDICLLKPMDEFFGPWGPEPHEILLLIEISDTSERYDRVIKAPLYAEAGIVEYWVLNIPKSVLEIHRDPVGGQYRSVETLSAGQFVSPVQLPDVTFAVADILK